MSAARIASVAVAPGAAPRRRRGVAVALAAIAVAAAAHLALVVALARIVDRAPRLALPTAEPLVVAPEPPPPPAAPASPATSIATSPTARSSAAATASAPPALPMPALRSAAPARPSMPRLAALIEPTPMERSSAAPMLLPTIAAAPAIVASATGGDPLGGSGDRAAELRSQDALDQPVAVRSKVLPTYPPRAVRAGLTDAVTVRFTVGVDGRAHDIELVHAAHPEVFAEPTIAMVRDARFELARRGGQAVPATCLWTVSYVPPR